MKKRILAILPVIMLSCTKPETKTINEIAEDYVKLALEIGQYDSDFVDAYFGPEELKPIQMKADSFPVENFISKSSQLIDQLKLLKDSQISTDEISRKNLLVKQLIAVKTKVEMLGGKKYSFDEEIKLLYDAEIPKFSYDHFDSLLMKIDQLIPGEATLEERYEQFIQQFIIPADKMDTLYRTAIKEARKRTLENMTLPENEDINLEYVTDKSWGAYNYYQGDGQSLIQINTDFPAQIDRVILRACHEIYPGHHVYNNIIEQRLYKQKGWVEYSVYLLFSPMSMLLEGTANYGPDVAFPGDQRITYEKEVLFPLAGFDPTLVEKYYEIVSLLNQLNYVRNEAARDYLNGVITRKDYVKIIQKYWLFSEEKARNDARFVDQYRSYVINYNYGLDLVTKYIDSKGGLSDNPKKRWMIFEELLNTPNTASALEAELKAQ